MLPNTLKVINCSDRLAELDRLGFSCEYHMVEIGSLGHFLKESISAMETMI